MGRHKLTPPRRRGVTAALAASCVALGGLVAFGLSADGQQPAAVSGDQTCSFTVTDTVVSTLACVAAPTTPPVTTAPSVSPTPSATETTPPPTTTAPPTSSASPSSSATFTETPTEVPTGPSTAWPGPSNTGVPAGIALTNYTGSKTIASGAIDGKTISGDLTVTGTATIRNSIVKGTIHSTGAATLIDDEIIGSNSDQTLSVIYGQNITAERINVHGGKANIQCVDRGCVIKDSWLHDPYFISPNHYDSIGSNGVDGMTVDHNTLQCKFSNGQGPGAGGCTADLGFFGDFAPIQNVTVSNNLFMASSDAGYCVDTNAAKAGKAFPNGKNLIWTNNTFQRGSNGKCGYYGAVDEWQSGNGNVWSGNHWDDGKALNE